MNLHRQVPFRSLFTLAAFLCLPAIWSSAACADDRFLIEDRTFRAEIDGTEQRYILMTPEKFSRSEPASVLIALHGHGSDRWQFVRQPRDECRAVRDIAAESGLLLVAPDYRATTSWMGPAATADVVQIIQQLRMQFKVERIVLCGASMGGTAALTFAALHPDLIDGIVSMNGTANLLEYDRFQDAIAESFGGTKQQVPDEYQKRSAELFPDRFTMPVAATTGGRDDVVPGASVLRLLKSIRQHNDAVLSLHRPNGGHSTNLADARQALEFVLSATEQTTTPPASQQR